MKINYRRSILRIFLIMSAMFVVVAITSACINNGDGDEPIYKPGDGDITACTEGYKIVFADKKFENAFVIAGKDGDLNRTIDVKFDQLTRANGFGAAMPEFKSLYATAVAANADKGLKVKENDGVIGFWGDYSAGLSRFILGLNIKDQTGTIDGSGPAVDAVDAVDGTRGKVAKPDENAPGFTNDSYTMALTSGPAWVTGAGWLHYNVTKVDGGAFHDQILGVPGEIDTWFYATIGRLEGFPEVINRPMTGTWDLFGIDAANKDWELDDERKGHTTTDNYERKKGWQHLFSIKPCDETVKNGLIAAQVTKKGVAAEIDGTLIDAEKLHIKGEFVNNEWVANNEFMFRMRPDVGKKIMFIDSFIAAAAHVVFHSTGFATMNYNKDADTGITAENFHTTTKLGLMCRTTIEAISGDQPDLFEAPGEGAVVKADLFTDGAKELKCYLSISNLYPEWYEAVVQEYNTTNTLDKMFKVEAAAEDRLGVNHYDTETKTVGLVIADTGDVSLNTEKSKALFYTEAGNNSDQQGKWKAFIEQGGVETIYGTLKFNFVRPDIK